MSIRVVDAGKVPALRSQAVYHGLAKSLTRNTPDTIILVTPQEPYVCIGFHQEVDKEVDVDYCKKMNLPVVRREVGGGAVYLDEHQLFTQWVFQPDRLPWRIERRFELFARPLVETYKHFGIEAYYRPINDIQVAGRKIGGTGAAAIGNAEVMVGSFLFDFNFEVMAKVFKVPNEKFRDKVFHSLKEYMTTMKRELQQDPDPEEVKNVYLQQCEKLFGEKILVDEFTEAELDAITKYDEKFTSEEWLYQKGGLKRAGIKIHTDVWVYENNYKAQGGLIRVTLRLRENLIDDLSLSGDFTFHPHAMLKNFEKTLIGLEANSRLLEEKVKTFYQKYQIQTPGIEPRDWVQSIMQCKENS